jgi:hypothetical protein
MKEGVGEDNFNQKQDFRTKQLEFFQNIFIKKLKYDNNIRHNKSESKEIKKYISEINKQKEKIYEHYFKVEKELLEYIALLQTKIYPLKRNESDLKEMNENILNMLEYFKKKKLKVLQNDKNELEMVLYKYQSKKDKERTNNLHLKYKQDLNLFQSTEKLVKEITNLLPTFRKLEKECNKLEQINTNLRVKYDSIKVEQNCLYQILNKIKYQKEDNKHENKKENKKYILLKNKSCIFKRRIKAINKNKNNISNNSSLNSLNNKKNDKFFISQNYSNYNKIYLKKNNLPKNRCSSAKIINRNNLNIIAENDEKIEFNNQITESLKKLNYYANIKYKELQNLCAKEIKSQNNFRVLLELCVEDLNSENKAEKNEKFKENLENKIFILSYLYDNIFKNGEIKALKREYSMFLPKKNN